MIAHPAPPLPAQGGLGGEADRLRGEAVRIVMGELLPNRVHTASELTARAAARAAKQEQEKDHARQLTRRPQAHVGRGPG